jgi:hypothetical protein
MIGVVRPRIGWTISWALMIGLCWSVVGGRALSTEKNKVDSSKPAVHVYSETLTAKDNLQDGPDGKAIAITSETKLIWVDLAPWARFAHDTEYLLITSEGTTIIKGQWWPVLNGKAIMRGDERNRLDDLIIKR